MMMYSVLKLWLNLDIRQDGEVKPCCVSEYTMGDIKGKISL